MGMRVAAAATAAVSLALLAAPALASRKPPAQKSWAQGEIALVTSHGLLAPDAASFRPGDPLTAGDLSAVVSALSGKDAPAPSDPAAPVTIAVLDAQLVGALGLRPTARQFADGARAAGLE